VVDQIWQGATWRRQVLISDGLDAPVDPTGLLAVLCPETPITVTQTGPGDYFVTLTDVETVALTPGPSHWELFGTVGSDVLLLVREDVRVEATCGREPA
jgi:hypothetical protein